MSTNIKRFGVDTTPGGRRALYGETVEGTRLRLVDTDDILHLGTPQLVGLLNAGLAVQDMRAALEALLDAVEFQTRHLNHGVHDTVQAARAAIAKAKGEGDA